MIKLLRDGKVVEVDIDEFIKLLDITTDEIVYELPNGVKLDRGIRSIGVSNDICKVMYGDTYKKLGGISIPDVLTLYHKDSNSKYHEIGHQIDKYSDNNLFRESYLYDIEELYNIAYKDSHYLKMHEAFAEFISIMCENEDWAKEFMPNIYNSLIDLKLIYSEKIIANKSFNAKDVFMSIYTDFKYTDIGFIKSNTFKQVFSCIEEYYAACSLGDMRNVVDDMIKRYSIEKNYLM